MPPIREDDYSNIPNSPPHPDADAEVQLPSEDLSSTQLDFLDLNPDIEQRASPIAKPTLKVYDSRDQFTPTVTQSPLTTTETRPRRLSAVQQTKFNAYVEEQLHHIQRNFIQSLGLGEHGYSGLSPLLIDVRNIINFIWLSIDPSNGGTTVSNAEYSSTLFGQSSYLISIANDLLDYLVKFKLSSESSTLLLKVLQSLDLKFSKLIDGDVPGNAKLLTTEAIRIHGIAERSRVFIASYFERNEIDGFHYELSKIYEGVLERTG